MAANTGSRPGPTEPQADRFPPSTLQKHPILECRVLAMTDVRIAASERRKCPRSGLSRGVTKSLNEWQVLGTPIDALDDDIWGAFLPESPGSAKVRDRRTDTEKLVVRNPPPPAMLKCGMAIKAIMVDVDGVLIIHPDTRGWSVDLERDLGISAESRQTKFWPGTSGNGSSMQESAEGQLSPSLVLATAGLLSPHCEGLGLQNNADWP